MTITANQFDAQPGTDNRRQQPRTPISAQRSSSFKSTRHACRFSRMMLPATRGILQSRRSRRDSHLRRWPRRTSTEPRRASSSRRLARAFIQSTLTRSMAHSNAFLSDAVLNLHTGLTARTRSLVANQGMMDALHVLIEVTSPSQRDGVLRPPVFNALNLVSPFRLILPFARFVGIEMDNVAAFPLDFILGHGGKCIDETLLFTPTKSCRDMHRTQDR